LSTPLAHALTQAMSATLWLSVASLAVGCQCRKETEINNLDPGSPDGDDDDSGDDDDDDDDEGDPEPEDFGTWLSADLAPEGGGLSIAYYDRGREAAGYAIVTFDSAGVPSFRHERVYGYDDDDDEVGGYTTQLTHPDGAAWVAMYDVDDDELVVRQRTARDTWADAETVGDGGQWAHIGLDPDDNVVVAHTDGAGKLLVSVREGGSWSTEQPYASVATDWTLPDGTLTTRDAEVRQPRVFTDGSTLYVAFYDRAKGELHLLSGPSAGQLTDEVVASGEDEGAWPSMVVHDGALHIAYEDVANEDLVLARRDGGSWSFEVIDDGKLAGADSEIIVHQDKLHIAYFNGFDSDLYLAVQDGGWQISRVEGGATAVGFHNEAVIYDGTLHIGSYDYTDRGLLFRAY